MHKDELNKVEAGCLAEKSKYIVGNCPLCGKELEFFSIEEMQNQKNCYNCKEPFDSESFAKKVGLTNE